MTNDARSRVFVTGAAGFVGHHIIEALGDRPVRALINRSSGDLGQRQNVETVTGSVTDPHSLAGLIDGSDTVIHLVAIIDESNGQTFDEVIRQGTENVLAEAQRAGTSRFILMSANGAQDDPRYDYMSAKWAAEQAVIESGLSYTIFRPSIIFGPGDGFINQLADVVKTFPVIPVVGDGTSRFQPVHVTEVADAFRRATDDADTTRGQTYELGGPEVYTYRELLDTIASELGKSKPKVNIPVGLMKMVVTATTPLPARLRPPVTLEQLKMLALDNSTPNSATASLIGRPQKHLADSISYIRN